MKRVIITTVLIYLLSVFVYFLITNVILSNGQGAIGGEPNSGVTITQPAWESRVGEIDFVDMGRVILTISPLDEDGTFTVTLGPDIEWDEAGIEFWQLMESFAEPNRFNWSPSSPPPCSPRLHLPLRTDGDVP